MLCTVSIVYNKDICYCECRKTRRHNPLKGQVLFESFRWFNQRWTGEFGYKKGLSKDFPCPTDDILATENS